MTIRIGHLSTFYHTAILLMAGNGIGRQLGLEADWHLYGTGPAIVNAFERKELDLAYIGLPPAIIGMERGVEIRCIAGGHIEGTVLCGRADYRGFPESGDLQEICRQFQGQHIGVPGKGSIHDVILKEIVGRYGLEDAVTVMNFPWADQITEAAVKGTVSAAVGTPALAVALRQYAGFRLLYPPALLWPYNPSYGILADIGFLRRERETVQGFLRLHEEAARVLRERPAEAAGIISGEVGFISADFVLETLEISPRYCAALTEGYISTTMQFAACLKRLGYISREMLQDEIFDTSLISEVHPEKDHYHFGV
ncbi:MAG: ABC transporter substrate-binding protein [Thermodesulfovibrionales bacterium]